MPQIKTIVPEDTLESLKQEALIKGESLSSYTRNILEDTLIKRVFLVDYENVNRLLFNVGKGDKVIVFLGAGQKQIAIDDAIFMQKLGRRGEYVYVSHKGTPNAVDFYITYYLGKLRILNPDYTYIIVSEDSGYDVVLDAIRGEGADCKRIKNTKPAALKRSLLVWLRSIHRPKTLEGLESMLQSSGCLTDCLSLKDAVNFLIEEGFVVINGGKLAYNLTS